MSRIKDMDLTTGSIFNKLFIFAVPFIFTNILQILFNAADVAVVGIFVGDDAVAAVGANGSLINLLVGLFVGLSIGSNVVLARYAGAKDLESSRRTVGTSLLIALIAGMFLMIIGVAFTDSFLLLMKVDAKILGLAGTYLKIYFLGMPVSLLYNFSASLLRAAGDTRRPLIFLTVSGVLNVGLNVFFIVVCKMTIEGVAIATISSQALSAVLCLITLFKNEGYANLKMKYVRIYKKQVKEILTIGVPSGLQSIAFGISNVLIQSTVNSMGDVAMSANTAASQFDGIIYNIGNAISMSCMSFIGQNIGAKRPDRVKRVILCGVLLTIILQFTVGLLFALLAPQLCSIIVNGRETIEKAATRLSIMAIFYFICGIMEVLSNSIRAMGKPIISFIISVMGATVFRIIFMEATLSIWPGFATIYWSYPASWIFTVSILAIFIVNVFKKTKVKLQEELVGKEIC